MKLFFLGLLFISIVHNALSLKCYQCVSDKNCKDNPAECPSVPGFDPPNACFKFEANNAVAKTCFTTSSSESAKCESGTHQGTKGTICFCKTDLCNNAQVSAVNKMMMFAVVSVAVFMQKFI